MSLLILRGFKHEINLMSEGTGVYNIAEYSPGVPVQDEQDLILLCSDTFILNVVGKSREEVARHVSRLYRGLTAATDYYHYRSQVPCYLESIISGVGSTAPVWAAIRSFEFHELNDSYDAVNGNIIRGASLVIVREPWCAAPIQSSPYDIRDSHNNDITSRFVAPVQQLFPAQSFNSDPLTDAVLTRPAVTLPEDYVFMTNMYRYRNLFYIFANDGAPVENQQEGRTSQPWDQHIISESIIPSNELVLYVGASWRFSGFVLPTLYYPDQPFMTGLTVEYRNAEGGWTEIGHTGVTNYLDVHNTAYSYVGILKPGYAWTYGEVGELYAAYYLRVTIEFGGVPVGIRIRAGHPTHIPYQPFIDVIPPQTGDLPAAIHMKIAGLSPWRWLDSVFGTSYQDSIIHLNSVIIASAPIPKDGSQNNDPGIGFYSLTDSSPYNDPEAGQPPSEEATLLFPGDLPYADAGVLSGRNPFKTIVVPTRPGTYRAFVRYAVKAANGTKGRATLFLSTSPSAIEGVHDGYALSRPYSIDLGNFKNQMTLCLADFGVVEIGNRALRETEGETSYGATTVQTDASSVTRFLIESHFLPGSVGRVYLADLILLPMDEHYMMMSMSRGPLPRNTSLSDLTRDEAATQRMWELVSDHLYVSSLYPGGATATTATDFIERPMTFPENPDLGIIHNRRVNEEVGLINSHSFFMPIETKRRMWFLWYKDVGDGILWSTADVHTAVKMYAIDRYITLPASR